jgi:hypothetical protein
MALATSPAFEGGFAVLREEQPLLNALHVGMEGFALGI